MKIVDQIMTSYIDPLEQRDYGQEFERATHNNNNNNSMIR